MASELRDQYESLFESAVQSSSESVDALILRLRSLVLRRGLPEETTDEREVLEKGLAASQCPLRGRVWKALLRLNDVDAARYIALLERGKSSVYEKVKDDSYRTFKTDKDFRYRVPEEKILRVLNSYAHVSSSAVGYVQGMNVLVAPFLYCLPEVDAFYCFSRFISLVCPTYVLPKLEGVYVGCQLLGNVLAEQDAELHSFIEGRKLDWVMVGFKYLLTFCAAIQPLSEVLKLWDFFFACGFHLNVLAFAGVLMDMRQAILSAKQPVDLLREIGHLDSSRVIQTTVRLAKAVSADLYARIAKHLYELPK